MMQLRIELLGIDPPIWRRILMPALCTFWDLHVAIQNVMGWTDSHLHAFRVIGSEKIWGIPDDDSRDLGLEYLPDWETEIADHLAHHKPLALYEYDFGDSWLHEIRFEGIDEVEERAGSPRCIGGSRRCPPENCGGAHRYEELLSALADAEHPDHDSWLERCGGSYDPEVFEAAEIEFEDPQKRWRELFDNTSH